MYKITPVQVPKTLNLNISKLSFSEDKDPVFHFHTHKKGPQVILTRTDIDVSLGRLNDTIIKTQNFCIRNYRSWRCYEFIISKLCTINYKIHTVL